MQIHRLFKIVYILLDKKKVTANELATQFEVSKRTILRDIETLSMAGIPIYTTKGKGGGIGLLDHFVLNKTLISDQEQDQILIALQTLTFTQHPDANNILSKLATLFQKADTTWIEVDLSRWGNTKSDKDKFDIIKQAIAKEVSISFTYFNSAGESTIRNIYPLKLVFKSKAWYIQAYCLQKSEVRKFKVNRMFHITLSFEHFSIHDFTLPPIEENYFSSDQLIHLKLLFSSDVTYRIYDEFDIDQIIKNDDDTFLVTLDLPHDAWLYSFLLSFGSTVQVIEPEYVKEILLDQIEEIKKLYL